MKKLKTRISALLALICSLVIVFTAVPARADVSTIDQDTADSIASNVESFLSQVYTITDYQFEQLKAEGGFYEELYYDWMTNRKTVGDYVNVNDVEIDDSTGAIVAKADVQFENFDTEVDITFDDQYAPSEYSMTIEYVKTGEDLLTDLYTADDRDLELKASDQGGFYEVFWSSWQTDRETTGKFLGFDEDKETVVDNSDPDAMTITCYPKFENYTAEAVLTYDENHELSNYVLNIDYSFGEKMGQAGQNMAVGLLTVFAVLVILIVVISLFRFIPNTDKKKKEEPTAAKAAPAKTAAPAPVKNESTSSGAGQEEEIAAAIAAALAAAAEESPSSDGYVVRSVKKTGRRWTRV